jgi:hypothetical protein
MSTEFNELLPIPPADRSDNSGGDEDKVQIWIIASREQVIHTINEFYVKRIANDRVKFTPPVPAPFAPGKYISILER